MRRRMGWFGVIVLVAALAATVVPLSGQKKPGTSSPLWSATATFRSLFTDALTSDKVTSGGSPVPYVNGLDGVTCVVVPDDPSLQTAGDFSLYFSSKTRRAIRYAGQAGSFDGNYPGFDEFYDKGNLRVKQVASVPKGSSASRTVILYSQPGKFLGDGATEQIDTAQVSRSSDGCTWVITVQPKTATDAEGHPVFISGLSLWSTAGWDEFAGVFAMPFQVTVTANSTPTAYGSCADM